MSLCTQRTLLQGCGKFVLHSFSNVFNIKRSSKIDFLSAERNRIIGCDRVFDLDQLLRLVTSLKMENYFRQIGRLCRHSRRQQKGIVFMLTSFTFFGDIKDPNLTTLIPKGQNRRHKNFRRKYLTPGYNFDIIAGLVGRLVPCWGEKT